MLIFEVIPPRVPLSDYMRVIMDDLVMFSWPGSPAMFIVSEIGSACRGGGYLNGGEELFAFARCCSPFVQMGSVDWIEHPGRKVVCSAWEYREATHSQSSTQAVWL